MIVKPKPPGGIVLHVLNRFKQVLTQPAVSYRAVVALDVGVLLRLARLDKLKLDIVLVRPLLQILTDNF